MELFKLMGKIAVDNAEARKALQDVSNDGQQAESKLSKVFGGIGKGAAVVGKAVATGLAAGATACVGLATAAINSYGDYEQLVGGIETLFGTRGAKSVEEYAEMVGKSVKDVEAEFGMLQEAQSKAMENAANAYKTAGMSANEYMETASGLAAALNQSSASQLESAELADQAIIDMADNAAKMGTSMESIQNAYAGFSKQNYTMLDNLKLGYGGTKEEMQRLLDDASKLESAMGRKFDINNFADVTEAIHLMQVEMGIAGTTAKEASGTIQGSFGMLKGAWSNLLTGLSDPDADLTTLINNVFTSVTTFAGNLVPRISQVLSGIATAFSQLAPLITSEIPNLLNQVLPPLIDGAVALVDGLVSAMPAIVSALMTALPTLIDGVLQLITSLALALPQIIDPIIGALPGIIQAILQALPTLIPALIDGVVNLIMMLVEMLPQIIQPIIDNLPTIIISIVEALVGNLPVLIEGLIQLIMGIVTALPQIIQALVDALPTIISLIVEAVLTNLPLLIAGLIQVVAGIVAALPQIFGALISAIPAVFIGIWDGIKNTFSGVGEWFSSVWQSLGNVPGLSSLKTMIEQVWGAIKGHIETVVGAIKNVITTYWDSIKNVISTVLNSIKNVITTAWNAVKTIISNVMKLISSVLKGDWEGVKQAISNILNAIKSVIKSVWDGIKNTISSVLNGIKNVISSIWNGIKSVISSYLNMIKTTVSSVWNGIKGAISGVVNGIKTTVSTGFNDVKNKVINAFTNLPSKLKSIGKNLVEGLWKGITNTKDWLLNKIKGFAKTITNGIKNFFGIKSPSRVMRDEVGKQLAEGVAVGIEENTEKVENSAETMSEKVLEAAQKRLDDYKVYNELTLADEVAFWDSIRVQCTEGTDARIEADKKYFKAKQEINTEILSAEEKLQNSLDEINQRVINRTGELVGQFGLFDSGIMEESDLTPEDMLNNITSQVNTMTFWEQELGYLKSRIGEGALFDEIKGMGVEALDQVRTLNKMDEHQLKQFTTMYDQRWKIANRQATKELATETQADKEKAFEEYGQTLAGLGVITEEYSPELQREAEIVFEGVRKKIAEKMGLAANDVRVILLAIQEMIKNFNIKFDGINVDNVGMFASLGEAGIEWHAKAMNHAMLLDKPTIFGYDAASGKYLGAGEAGTEVVAGSNTLMRMISSAVAEQSSSMTYYMQKIIEVLATYFPQVVDSMGRPLVFDTVAAANAMAVPMNEALGKISSRKDRGR